ncbi:hypothetical protein H4R35_002374 [Dimargaris xerosporica]|nr:hypothetical protein H4R35_002374 [Dimargaris xerosporica]
MEFRKRTGPVEPEVVVFSDPQAAMRPGNDAAGSSRKNFMSSKLSKVNADSSEPSASSQKPKAAEPGSEYNKMVDRILNQTGVLDQIIGSSLAGKERITHMKKRLAELGAQPEKKRFIPREARFQELRDRKRQYRAEQREAQASGTLTGAMQRELEKKYNIHSVKSKEPKEMSEFGITKYMHGIMKVNKHVLHRHGKFGRQPRKPMKKSR